jgi:hypothetical protein
MKTNAQMTLYNGYVSGGVQHYQRTPIVAVVWESVKASNVIRSGLIAADSAAIYIPLSMCANYLKPLVWQALAVKVGHWTLQVGDYIVKGLVVDEITTSFSITNLKAKWDDCLQVKSVDTMDEGSARMRHFRLGAQ